jgi:hypothetical protein
MARRLKRDLCSLVCWLENQAVTWGNVVVETRGVEPLNPALQGDPGCYAWLSSEVLSVGLRWPVTVTDQRRPLVRTNRGSLTGVEAPSGTPGGHAVDNPEVVRPAGG